MSATASLRRALTLPLAAVPVWALALLSCGSRSEYDLEPQGQSPPAASAESTDGSLRAALGEMLLPLVESHDTQYAPGFREEVFRSLRLGSREAEVRDLLGEPLLSRDFPDGGRYWYYSRQGDRSPNYFVRALVFDRNGALLARRRYFYVD